MKEKVKTITHAEHHQLSNHNTTHTQLSRSGAQHTHREQWKIPGWMNFVFWLCQPSTTPDAQSVFISQPQPQPQRNMIYILMYYHLADLIHVHTPTSAAGARYCYIVINLPTDRRTWRAVLHVTRMHTISPNNESEFRDWRVRIRMCTIARARELSGGNLWDACVRK